MLKCSYEVINMSKYQENLSPSDLFLELEAFSEGRSTHAWRCFGSHPARSEDGTDGYLFRVWAPNAPLVSLIGDFNGWDINATPMEQVEGGIWEAFVPGLHRYDAYQYAIHKEDGSFVGKADPYGFHAATRPDVSTKIYDLWENAYQWGDQSWLEYRSKYVPYTGPMNIYECHLGSWRRTGEGEFLSYRDLAAYMNNKGLTPPETGAVVNDTVATLLGGYLAVDRSAYDGFVGFILGTGLNCCYSERGERIAKRKLSAWDNMVINLEAGSYDRFPQGDFDRALDAVSREPGRHPLEKMTSGAYLGTLMELTLKGAAKEGLFTPPCTRSVLALDGLSLSQVSAWLDGLDGGALPQRRSRQAVLHQEEADETVETLRTGKRRKNHVAAESAAVLLHGPYCGLTRNCGTDRRSDTCQTHHQRYADVSQYQCCCFHNVLSFF